MIFFAKQGMPVDQHTNPADHFLDLINYDFTGGTSSRFHCDQRHLTEVAISGGEMPDQVRKLVDNFPHSRAARCNAKRIEHTRDNVFMERAQQLSKEERKKKYANATWSVLSMTWVDVSHSAEGVCFRYQTLVLMRRTFVVFLKNPAIYWARILM